MDLRQLTPDFFVSPQIDPEDMPQLASAGIATILCNRPDEEIPPPLQSDAIRAAAEAAGLRFEFLPLTHQTMTEDRISQQGALAASSGPVLAYCASGTRSTVAWSLSQAGTMATDDIIGAARSAGYDLEGLRATLEALAASRRV